MIHLKHFPAYKSGNGVLFFNETGALSLIPGTKLPTEIFEHATNFLVAKKIAQKKDVLHELQTPDFRKFLLVKLETDVKIKNHSVAQKTIGSQIGKAIAAWGEDQIEIILPESKETIFHKFAADFFEGLLLSSYRFESFKHKKNEDEKNSLHECRIVGETDCITADLEKAELLASSVCLARDCANSPSNAFTPSDFKKAAHKLADEASLKFTAINEEQMEALGFGCFLSVTQGSEQPAYLNILEYQTGNPETETLLLVGKGLTFDCGGISIKPSASMEEMKFDMCGGAAVLGAMRIIGFLKPEVNVIGMIPSSENLINGKAVKPGDIITAFNGKTVEIINTDAEGRLILCDTIAYGIKTYSPSAVIDLATLTGACMVALGKYNSGIFSNNEELSRRLQEFGKKTGDQVWPMPLDEEYAKEMEGFYSDLVNAGSRYGGAITAAKFLQNFVDEVPWAHIDIAGTAWNVKNIAHYPEKGATGVGVRLISDLVMSWSSLKTK